MCSSDLWLVLTYCLVSGNLIFYNLSLLYRMLAATRHALLLRPVPPNCIKFHNQYNLQPYFALFFLQLLLLGTPQLSLMVLGYPVPGVWLTLFCAKTGSMVSLLGQSCWLSNLVGSGLCMRASRMCPTMPCIKIVIKAVVMMATLLL